MGAVDTKRPVGFETLTFREYDGPKFLSMVVRVDKKLSVVRPPDSRLPNFLPESRRQDPPVNQTASEITSGFICNLMQNSSWLQIQTDVDG